MFIHLFDVCVRRIYILNVRRWALKRECKNMGRGCLSKKLWYIDRSETQIFDTCKGGSFHFQIQHSYPFKSSTPRAYSYFGKLSSLIISVIILTPFFTYTTYNLQESPVWKCSFYKNTEAWRERYILTQGYLIVFMMNLFWKLRYPSFQNAKKNKENVW